MTAVVRDEDPSPAASNDPHPCSIINRGHYGAAGSCAHIEGGGCGIGDDAALGVCRCCETQKTEGQTSDKSASFKHERLHDKDGIAVTILERTLPIWNEIMQRVA